MALEQEVQISSMEMVLEHEQQLDIWALELELALLVEPGMGTPKLAKALQGRWKMLWEEDMAMELLDLLET